jgi:branched-chain amino acid transport system ATP-binding protein
VSVVGAEPILAVDRLTVRFGGLVAVDGVSFGVRAGEIVGVIGPNGAGKTTTFNAIAGHVRPTGGTVRLKGQDVTGWPPERMAQAGLARTFQLVRLFRSLSVVENVMVAAATRHRSTTRARVAALEILDRLGLAGRADEPVGRLTLADQKKVEIARALGAEPDVLLLDEMMSGLTQDETDDMLALVREINARQRITLVVVEHVMPIIHSLCERVLVFDYGRLIAEGPPAAVMNNPDVIAAYIGRRRSTGGSSTTMQMERPV